MDDLSVLYQEIILDHSRNPRCFGDLDPCDQCVEGINPLCGDEIKLFLSGSKTHIKELRFTGHGCAISIASASILCSQLEGLEVGEAKKILQAYQAMLTQADAPAQLLKKLEVFRGVKQFPSRIKCATLASHAILSVLSGETSTVTTESE